MPKLLTALLAAVGATLASFAVPAAGHAAGPETLLIRGAKVVDPEGEATPSRADVLVADGKVVRVAGTISPPRGARVIEARGRFLVPGLWDCHAHLTGAAPVGNRPEGYVGNGVLAVRDMGGHLDQLLALKQGIADGRVGPALLIAGPTLNGEAFADFHRTVATEAEARAAVRELKAAGVDHIKTHRATTRPVYFAMLDEARKVGLPVVGHVPLELKWAEAASAGQQTIEHVQTIVENEVSDLRSVEQIKAGVARLEGPYGDELFATMAARRTFFDPTLIAYEASIDRAKPEVAALRRQLYERLKPMVGRASKAGVPILAGTDLLEQSGAGLLDELDRLVQSGLTPRQALRAATTTAARAARRPDLGRIEAGATASFLIVDSDPTAEVAALRRLHAVVLRGRLIHAAELERLRKLDR